MRGNRIADLLGYDYYDREIIAAIVEQTGLNEQYVERQLENHAWQNVPLTFHRSFANFNLAQISAQTSLLLEQKKIIERIARAGNGC